MSVSANLRVALKKMRLYRLADLNGITGGDFHRISRNGSELVLELDELIDAVRIGSPPANIETVCVPTCNPAQSEQPGISAIKTELEPKPNFQFEHSSLVVPRIVRFDCHPE